MYPVANEPIEIIRRPDRAFCPASFVYRFRRKGFPVAHDVAERESVRLLDSDVDMVRHDHPGNQAITLAVEMLKRLLDERRVFGNSKQASASSVVNCLVQPPAPVRFVCSGRDRFVECGARQTVRQPECDHVHHGTAIEMRQVAALVPAKMRAGRPRSREDLPTIGLAQGHALDRY